MTIRILFFSFLSAFILSACGSSSSTTSKGKKNFSVDYYAGNYNLKELVQKETTAGKTPILFFTASWCKPCMEFKKTLKDQEVADAFSNAKLIIVDADIDKNKDKLTYLYAIGAIPTFIKLDANAEPVNTMVGGDWTEPTPSQIALSMRKFIR